MQTKIKTVEVARSCSRKLNLGNYETMDFFCSQKVECLELEKDKVSEEVAKWCEEEVMKSLADYGLRNAPPPEPPKVTRQDYAIAEREAPGKVAEANAKLDVLAEEKYNEELSQRSGELPTLNI